MADDEKVNDSILDPIDRISEILFGLIMVLTFTGSMSAADIGRDDVRTMLIGAIGCNIAWGLIDSLMYLMATLTSRARVQRLAQQLQVATSPEVGRKLISAFLPNGLGSMTSADHLEHLRKTLLDRTKQSPPQILLGADLYAAFKIFLLVFFSTLPVVLPFIILADPSLALRISNLIAVLMLFRLGYALGHYAGHRPMIWGAAMAVTGVMLVSLTIALGG